MREINCICDLAVMEQKDLCLALHILHLTYEKTPLLETNVSVHSVRPCLT
jgi:hypothetical protein